MFANGHAIIIGVGGDLPRTENDAQAIANLLTNPQKCAYPPEHVHLLVGQNATRTAILETLQKVYLATGTNHQASLFFYFSGHGKQVKNGSNYSYFLLPWNYNVLDLSATAISGDEIISWIKLFRNAQKMCMVFDCCHAGGIAQIKSTGNSLLQSFPMPPDIGTVLTSGKGRVAIASSRADEVSIVGKQHSLFTEALLEALTGKYIHDADNYIRVLDVFGYLCRIIPKRTSGSQNPILNVVDLDDNFALAYNDDNKLEEANSLEMSTNERRNTNVSKEQLRTWERILENHRTGLLLIEQRMSEYVTSTDIPLQYIREKALKEQVITDLESKIQLKGNIVRSQ